MALIPGSATASARSTAFRHGEWQAAGSLLAIAAGLLLAWGREATALKPRALG